MSCLWSSWTRKPREEVQRLQSLAMAGKGPWFTECDKKRVYQVGSTIETNFHLCEEHVCDPVFKRMKKRRIWPENAKLPLFAIVNEIDGPYASMVCQWTPESGGYCYLCRKDGKKRYDGMKPAHPTDIRDFGFEWDIVGNTVFFRMHNAQRAIYLDGADRPWADRRTEFSYNLVKPVQLR